MHRNGLSKQLAALQQELHDLAFDRALALARTMPREQFAAVLWEASPHPGPNTVAMDLDALTVSELEAIVAWGGK